MIDRLIDDVMKGVNNVHHVKLRKPLTDSSVDYTVYTTDVENRGADDVLGIQDISMSVEIYSESSKISESKKTICKNLNAMAIGFDVNATVYIEPDKRYMTLITFTHTTKGGYGE